MTTGGRYGCWRLHSITGQIGSRICRAIGEGLAEAGARRKSPILN